MMKILSILLLTISIQIFAQGENKIWYFGDKAGIDFNSGTPVALTNGSLQSFEGNATISDPSGNLLFYTNGGPLNSGYNYTGAIWNRNHTVMPNGALDSADGGCNSSAQSALIVPNPGNPNQFYVFTTDCQENAMLGGFRYSIVDMTLDGGLGDVTVKGVSITNAVAESMCGIKHANGTDFWVIVHKISGSRAFYAYQITGTGISAPVITTIGHKVYQNAGQMTATIDGSKIGYCSTDSTAVFDFDNSTGILSNYADLNKHSFGGSFSANCRFFYTSYNVPPYDKIYQFDMDAPSIPGSEVLIADSTNPTIISQMGSLQLAPNGKIYIGRLGRQYLGVINNANLPGNLADYQANGFYLGGRTSHLGLPNLINGFYGACSPNLAIEGNSGLNPFNIYPNPFSTQVNFETEIPLNDASLTVYNSLGQPVKQLNHLSGQKITLLRDHLPMGMYVVRIREGNKILMNEKLVITNE